jgi:uncharacterized protein
VRIEVRVYGDLVDLTGEVELSVPVGRARSVKDLVESVGVPHPEIGLLVVDGDAVGFDHLVDGGARVAVCPPFHDLHLAAGQGLWPPPPDPRRFVLDVHLGTLARRLRLLGFDTWYRTEADDLELADVAVSDARILLTRDRELLMRRVIVHGYLPRSDDPDDQLAEVVRRYRLAGRTAPLTRCVPCNGELTPVPKAEVIDLVPPRTRVEHDTFVRCRSCGQVYWPGSHLGRIGRLVDRVRSS